ncbi:hypothetical protein [Jeotgalibaca dankookensis]|uniref:hypothetical protein n=1 Tax=Jeotgalibaca dankookensis TaxID=708126 RepID=UPI00078458D0|nr:hypothetical protein [Jeotgalibaca dankookensis]
MENNKPELNLFIIWEKARYKQNEILNDMQNRFKIINVYEVEWSEEYFSQNMTRFYGQKLPKGSHKEKHCGRGSFILIVFLDEKPKYLERPTSRGKEIVNINTFDVKALYREWTGGGHKIHGTNSIIETNHDLALLLGMSSDEYLSSSGNGWNNEIKKIKKDLHGYNGWQDIEELFKILNSTTQYVVLRNFDCLPDEYTMENHGDIDLLVEDYNEIKYILNSKEVFSSRKYRVHNSVRISGDEVLFDFRYISDNYYDASWEKKILEKRVLNKKGFYVPDIENYFYSLLYHAVIHKYKISDDYLDKLLELSGIIEDIKISKDRFKEVTDLKNILDLFMMKNNYEYTEPKDLSVVFNNRIVKLDKLTFNRMLLNKKKDIKDIIKKYIFHRD